MLRFAYPSLDSTNPQARKLAREHPQGILLVSAVTQTAGRGRIGRPWQSPPGGAWFTWVCPTHGDPRRYTAAPLLAGLAVLESVQDVVTTHVAAQGFTSGSGGAGVPRLTLKWPNDVLLDDAKVAGILCEHELPPTTHTATAGSTNSGGGGGGGGHLFIGIGINANLDPAVLGGDLRYPATSLQHQLGAAVDVTALIERVAGRLMQHIASLEAYGWTPALAREVEAHLAWRGERVVLDTGDEAVHGCCVGLGNEGGLVLALEDPHVARVIQSGAKAHGVAGHSIGVTGQRTFHVGEVTKLRRL